MRKQARNTSTVYAQCTMVHGAHAASLAVSLIELPIHTQRAPITRKPHPSQTSLLCFLLTRKRLRMQTPSATKMPPAMMPPRTPMISLSSTPSSSIAATASQPLLSAMQQYPFLAVVQPCVPFPRPASQTKPSGLAGCSCELTLAT